MSLSKKDCEYLVEMMYKINDKLIEGKNPKRFMAELLESKLFKKLERRSEAPDKEIDNRSREEKLKDKGYTLCKRCDLVLAKKHIRRHERTPRCLEIYKKKIASKKAKSSIVEQEDLINLDKKDKDDILKIYKEDEEFLRLIEEESKRIEEEEE